LIIGNAIQENNRLADGTANGGTGGNNSGIFIDVSARDGVISGNTIRGLSSYIQTQRYGIWLEGCDMHITGNRITGNSQSSFLIGTYGDGYGKRCYIADNYVDQHYFETRYMAYKNTSGSALTKGDVVVLSSVSAGNECSMTTNGGDAKVLGMADATIENNAQGVILIEGKTTALKADGTTPIAIGDFLSTFTTAGVAKKAAAGDMAFAVSLSNYSSASTGTISAILITPRKI